MLLGSILQNPNRFFGKSSTRLLISAILVLIIAMSSFAFANVSVSDSILLSQAQQGFESVAMGWEAQGNTSVGQEVFAGQGGSGALLIRVDEKGPWPDGSREARVGTAQFSRGISVKANDRLEGSVFVRGFDGSLGKARCEIREYADNRIIATHTSVSRVDVGALWVKLSCVGVMSSSAKQVALRINIGEADYGERFLADNASLAKTSTQTTTTQPPVTQPPVTQPPVTQPPTTQPPTTDPVVDSGLNLFLSDNELSQIKTKINTEPVKTAYSRLISSANSQLTASFYTVTKNGGPVSSNDYYTAPPLLSDGVINPNVDRTDYLEAGKVAAAVRDLSLVYRLTGDSRYANRAIFFLEKWMLDPVTRMTPKYTGGQSGIELSITMPGLFYGIDLLEAYPGWNSQSKQSVFNWVRAFNNTTTQWSGYNNWEDWRLVTLISGAALTGDDAKFDTAIKRWKDRLDTHLNSQGFFPIELQRKTSFDYSAFTLNAVTQIAMVAKHNGIDLYNYKSPKGHNLKSAFDTHAPYFVNPSSWPYTQTTTFKGDSAAIYEVGNLIYASPSYQQVIDRWKRPMYENWTLGWVTLTHSKGSYEIR